MAKIKQSAEQLAQAANRLRTRLRGGWWLWLGWRWLGVPILTASLLPTKPSLLGGVIWQGLWLLPALLVSPWVLTGRQPYALTMIGMLLLVYWGGSGMVALQYGLTQVWTLLAVWLVDFVLLGCLNYWLFMLLKKLPKMNA